jgi:hypothetical protein
MTSVEILFRYAVPPTDAVTFALANTGEVYGIRRLSFDRAARTHCAWSMTLRGSMPPQ